MPANMRTENWGELETSSRFSRQRVILFERCPTWDTRKWYLLIMGNEWTRKTWTHWTWINLCFPRSLTSKLNKILSYCPSLESYSFLSIWSSGFKNWIFFLPFFHFHYSSIIIECLRNDAWTGTLGHALVIVRLAEQQKVHELKLLLLLSSIRFLKYDLDTLRNRYQKTKKLSTNKNRGTSLYQEN